MPDARSMYEHPILHDTGQHDWDALGATTGMLWGLSELRRDTPAGWPGSHPSSSQQACLKSCQS